MTYRQKQKVSPGLIKAMFGDSLKAGWWLDQKPGATVVPDFSGNGHDGTPSNVEFGQRSLAPGMVGRSSFGAGVSSKIVAENASDWDWIAQTGVFTLIWCGWRADEDTATAMPLSNTGGGAQAGAGIWVANGSGLRGRFSAGGGGDLAAYSLAAGESLKPFMIALVGNGTDMRLHVASCEGLSLDVDPTPITPEPTDTATYAMSVYALPSGSFQWHGGCQFSAVADRAISNDEFRFLAELSGVKNPPAYYQPGYVSELEAL